MFYPHRYRFSSTRHLVYGMRGMVVTSQPDAARIGLGTLRQGGNAVDAAVSAAAALVVCEPTGCGLGSDAFFLGSVGGELKGLNASGPSPQKMDEKKSIAPYGARSVSVPGMVAGWSEMSEKLGRRTLAENLSGAICLAREGFALQPETARSWRKAFDLYQRERERYPEIDCWFQAFGRLPQAGEVIKFPDLADTLEEIALSDGEAFYRGNLAEEIVQCVEKGGGFLAKEDLSSYRTEWVNPLSQPLGDALVWELPPNGQGVALLIALGILRRLPYRDEADRVHQSIEAMKQALLLSYREITDPRWMRVDAKLLLEEELLETLAKNIGKKALKPETILPFGGGTVYLATADALGNMTSYIQSNYTGFGSGLVVPGRGISLQSRGGCFHPEKDHVNALAGGKRPYHTIIPGFLTLEGRPLGSFGLMGGLMQPMGHLQLLLGLFEEGLNPQEAIDRPRWRWIKGEFLEVEEGFDPRILRELEQRGHRIHFAKERSSFGKAQMIFRTPQETLVGAAEGRGDSMVASW